MTTRPAWVSDEIDLSRPSVARVYDYLLGGFHNFESDRELGEQVISRFPEAPAVARENRAFLRRAVEHLAREGVTQFLDVGAGIPTAGSVHEVAQAVRPEARVVYVDVDPVAIAHSRALLAGNPHATALPGNVLDPARILDDVRQQGLLDLDRPVAVLLVALLHFLGEDADPLGKVAAFREGTVPGSALVVSHVGREDQPDGRSESAAELYARTGSPVVLRPRAEVEAFFDGYAIAEPGVVRMEHWRPAPGPVTEHPERLPGWAGVGRRR